MFTPDETVRFRNQHQKIYDRLTVGPATNHELCGLALKYNARISEMRQQGINIKCVSHDRTTGVAVYELKQGEPALVDGVNPTEVLVENDRLLASPATVREPGRHVQEE